MTERETCLIFFDECGSHSLSAKEGFGAFVLSAVIIPAGEYESLDARWKEWKNRVFGRDAVIHEPQVRRGSGPFWFNGDYEKRNEARASLANILSELNFVGVACVVLRTSIRRSMDTTQWIPASRHTST